MSLKASCLTIHLKKWIPPVTGIFYERHSEPFTIYILISLGQNKVLFKGTDFFKVSIPAKLKFRQEA